MVSCSFLALFWILEILISSNASCWVMEHSKHAQRAAVDTIILQKWNSQKCSFFINIFVEVTSKEIVIFSFCYIILAYKVSKGKLLSCSLLDAIKCTSRRDILMRSQKSWEITVIVHETEVMPRERFGLMICHFL